MPVPLPPINDLQGSGTTPTSDAFRAAIGQLRTFISEKLGFSGSNSDAQTALGGGTVGKAVFVSSTTDPALTALGAGTVGKPVFTSNTVDTALTALGGTTYGKDIFQISDEIALAKLLGAGSVAANPSKIRFLLGWNHQAQIGNSVVTTDVNGLATITFNEQFFGKNGGTESAILAIVGLGDSNSMLPIAAVQSSYTSTTMQIKHVPSVTIRVNWLAVAGFSTVVIP